MSDPRELYLELLKRILCGMVGASKYAPIGAGTGPIRMLRDPVLSALRSQGLDLVRRVQLDVEERQNGNDHPADAETMIGMKRLDNLQRCVVDVIEKGVPGDLIETGVWRGGATILMRAVLAAYGDTERTVWVADSFQGVPPPDPERYPHDRGDRLYKLDYLAISADQVRSNFAKYGLLDERVRFLEGWFSQTLPTAPMKQIAVMRLDGDLYSSTVDALTHLYPKLSPGGYVIIDDYGAMPNCKAAVEDYRRDNHITADLMIIDWSGIYWQKP
jgi:O-methyltransferase